MWDLLLLFLAMGCLIWGSHWLISSVKSFALYLGLKPLFLSIVLLGFVSSSPEWFVTVTAAFRGVSDAALGNILGSNVINILLVLSLAGLFQSFPGDRQIVRWDLPFLIFSIAFLAVFLFGNQSLVRLESLFLIGAFIIYLAILFQKRKSSEPESDLSSQDKKAIWKSLAQLLFGFAILFTGSSLAVSASLNLVEAFSLSERFAGIFILSLSTSLPELATSLQAVFKKEGNMALGNIIGSNIFNTLFVLGSAGLIKPLSFSSSLYYDYAFMFLITFILYLSFLLFKVIPRFVFILFIISYFFYIAFVSGLLTGFF